MYIFNVYLFHFFYRLQFISFQVSFLIAGTSLSAFASGCHLRGLPFVAQSGIALASHPIT